MTTQAIAVPFHNQSLTAAIINDLPHVALKPICDNIGLQWEGQLQRIKRHPILSATMCMTHIVAEDGKLREMVMLPLKLLNGWLFGVDTNRVKNGTREKLIEYQRECFDVLANHFMPTQYGLKQLPEPPTLSALPGKLTLEQQDVIKALVKERAEALPKEMQAGATIRCWSAIKKKFGCTYKEVDSANFVNIISLLSRLPLEGELLSKPEPADNAIAIKMRDGSILRLTFDEHAEEPQRYFVDAFQGNIYVKALGHDSFSVNIADLPKVLSEPGVVDLKYLPLIAEACIKRWNAASLRT
jgi:hypothetical protein